MNIIMPAPLINHSAFPCDIIGSLHKHPNSIEACELPAAIQSKRSTRAVKDYPVILKWMF